MNTCRFSEEQKVRIVRDAVATDVPTAATKHGGSEQSLYRWRPEAGGSTCRRWPREI